ncbi:ABC transporter permease [bacterium]|nr:ABC transporter permease [bacterium]
MKIKEKLTSTDQKGKRSILEDIGRFFYTFLSEAGEIFILLCQAFFWLFRAPLKWKITLKQMGEVGVNSVPVTLITATFTGMVLALQSYIGFKRFNAETMVGTVVALSMVRELGPVLTGLIVAGRAGSEMAAELGTMKVTEQIDALYTLAVDPIHYLIVPRILAGIIMLPVLTILADFIGIAGGYLLSIKVLKANPVIYMRRTFDHMELSDIYIGLLKSSCFGLIISTVGCHKGLSTEGGAEGVGKATTGAVVLSSMLILISDYILTALLF